MEPVRINTRFKHGGYGQGIESPSGHGFQRLYWLLSEILGSDADDDPHLEEAADIMASQAEQAYTPARRRTTT